MFFVALFPQFLDPSAPVLPYALLMALVVVAVDVVWFSTLAKNPREGVTIALDARTGREVTRIRDGRYTPAVAVKDLLVITGVRTLYGLEPKAAP